MRHRKSTEGTRHRLGSRRSVAVSAQLLEFMQSPIVVGLIDGDHAGALDYALRRALIDASRIRMVRPVPTAPEPDLFPAIPLDIVEVPGNASDVLIAESRSAGALVVQTPSSEALAVMDSVLTKLRRETRCELIEVDRDGRVVRASGPEVDVVDLDEMLGDVAPRTSPRSFAPVTVGIDGSAAGLAALDWALANADPRQTVRIVVAYCPRDDEAEAHARSRAEDYADAALLVARHRCDPRGPELVVRVERGPAFDVLLNNAEDASVLVLGRHGTGSLIHSALSSVGDSCARLAGCPVVVVPRDGRQTGTHQLR